MTRPIVFLLFLLSASELSAQLTDSTRIARSSIFAELGGSGVVYSLNYDHIIIDRPFVDYSVRLGISGIPFGKLPTQYFLPAEVCVIVGKRKLRSEFGLGLVANIYRTQEYFGEQAVSWRREDFIILRIGGRFQKPHGGLFMRVGLTPFIGLTELLYSNRFLIIPWGGVAVGYTFRRKQ